MLVLAQNQIVKKQVKKINKNRVESWRAKSSLEIAESGPSDIIPNDMRNGIQELDSILNQLSNYTRGSVMSRNNSAYSFEMVQNQVRSISHDLEMAQNQVQTIYEGLQIAQHEVLTTHQENTINATDQRANK